MQEIKKKKKPIVQTNSQEKREEITANVINILHLTRIRHLLPKTSLIGYNSYLRSARKFISKDEISTSHCRLESYIVVAVGRIPEGKK